MTIRMDTSVAQDLALAARFDVQLDVERDNIDGDSVFAEVSDTELVCTHGSSHLDNPCK